MYSDKFVEELLKTIQSMADINKQQAERIDELEHQLSSKVLDPVKSLADKMPVYPEGDKAAQAKWWDNWKGLATALYNNNLLPTPKKVRL